MKNNVMLAVETSVGNGSLSLFENERLLDQWSGVNKIARSDRFLLNLDGFLKSNKINKNDLSLIAVSRGPGSFTGARVGLATVVAIKNGLGIPCFGVSVLHAAAVSAIRTTQDVVITAVPNDKAQIIREKFSFSRDDFPQPSVVSAEAETLNGGGAALLNTADFIEELKSCTTKTKILLEKSLFERIDEEYGINYLQSSSDNLELDDIGDNLSILIGRATLKNIASDNLEVLYLQN